MSEWSPQQRLALGLLLCLTALLFFTSLIHGATTLPFSVVHDLLNQVQSVDATILQDIRFPRAVLALTVGATLGLCGAVMQGMLRNPLACPSIIGISNGAALGAVISLYFGWSLIFTLAVPVFAIIGAAIATVCIFILSGRDASITTLILAGVAINALTGSLIALALNFSPNPYAMSELVYWLLGSLANSSIQDVYLILPFTLMGWFILLRCGRFLDALSLGEDTAKSLGFSISHQRTQLIIAVALCMGAAIAVSGSIGFVGLVIPHLLRPIARYEPSKLLYYSALGGAIAVLLADCIVQWLSPWQDIKLGIITALIGGPFFLYVILSTRKTLP